MYCVRRKGVSFISMLLQLKRFNMMGGKNGRPVTLAKNLDMSQYVRYAALSMQGYILYNLKGGIEKGENCFAH